MPASEFHAGKYLFELVTFTPLKKKRKFGMHAELAQNLI